MSSNRIESLKRSAKRLKKEFRDLGFDITHSQCLETMARAYGFAHWYEAMHRNPELGLTPDDHLKAVTRLRALLPPEIDDPQAMTLRVIQLPRLSDDSTVGVTTP